MQVLAVTDKAGGSKAQFNTGQAGALLACMIGFGLGGLAASTFGQAAELPISLGAFGGPLAGSFAAIRRKDIIETAAIGCAIGILLGAILALVDSFWA